ncbi:MAG: trifunctional transcriptional regulator/proline dehydrogenase/L-glutamate gamma-semialdehyde dehydrogenase [Ferrovibrio sp.]|uniref:trifunctional transcriptional regulator/proline dehydrogenase/L-glutamate gamma-semialdehyde dehydrogenase n=1 Tax=Ferrovibrio sp. TaxID=1917215 RepID=UPI0026256804|nr:trifunctional transcriptional regulator/proline dehydrogenase/L-glutamate gamma-semialdehyde dehydrogenase [Ferrovibrio sp.]MCW0235792.1 trifunctional transcriptional regulator/proline dehydrogenase/L-glutamate gamma-semialdehyde dehydrogenase [Ferrovibrio sp.]
MAVTTIGVKIDEDLKARLKRAADGIGRSPHWLIKQAIFSVLDRVERGDALDDLFSEGKAILDLSDAPATSEAPQSPFLEFAQTVQPQSVLRAKITAAYRRPEPECLPLLIAEASLPRPVTTAARDLARKLVETLRAKSQSGGVEGLIHEYSLSSQEGVALMCLAEALLRIPDRATRDALIRDKIGVGDWEAHLGHSPSLFVNAATWGLLITGRLTSTSSGRSLSGALTKLIARGGEPLIRKGVDIAMRMMGEQFVTGQTIAEALANSRKWEAQGFRYSYDMLGEAAATATDAQRYYADYEQAIHAIGKAAAKRGIYDGPGISVKLSALHPRYNRANLERVKAELLPRLKALTLLARRYDIGLNIDAEEADRLELSLDLLEALCFDPELAGWNGIGFVVQAYQKRAPFVLDWVIDLGRRSDHRLMVRLVKGAYWDSEIKRAQVDGLEGFPVYTRKVHTDVSYLACARKLLAAPDAVFPQFATHNAQTLATIHAMAGENYYSGQYEFQCLHGMGEPLYEEVVGREKLNRPCRIYAPVGTHETLLAYLVRRLLENGANTSFVNQIADNDIPLDRLIADPVETAKAIQPLGASHPKIALPQDILGKRRNSVGIDLSNEQRLASLSAALLSSADQTWRAMPLLADGPAEGGDSQALRNPANRNDTVGHVIEATPAQAAQAIDGAVAAAPIWQSTPPAERAQCLQRAADLLEARMPLLLGLIVREAGKSLPNAIGEVREAVDFLRYYAETVAAEFSGDTHRPLGPVVCISPWNFPLAIFTGQVAAALAAGNVVLAKPAEETPLIAAQMVRILHEAGVPPGAVQLLPGDGRIGAALVDDSRTRGVMFTGSTEVARLIQKQLVQRLSPEGRPIPLIAETGGLNAMIVDSSALPEQVVADVLASAFDSAGQRCSALRILCLQEDVADHVLTMLKGAMAELAIGSPDRLSVDVGPVITPAAQQTILAHIETMRAKKCRIEQLSLPPQTRHGTFVPPTLIELDRLSDLKAEIFGPVLHVVRYRRQDLEALIDQINESGYGLTFGLHSRIDETIAHVTQRIAAGNLYVNRNIIGAVVGVQPFGGHGLSGTGPKAGGPLYLRRLLASAPALAMKGRGNNSTAAAYIDWLTRQGFTAEAERCRDYVARSPLGFTSELAGPVGERNIYALLPRGAVRCAPRTQAGLLLQVGAAFATGNRAVLAAGTPFTDVLDTLPAELRGLIVSDGDTAVVLFEGDGDALTRLARELAEATPVVISVFSVSSPADDYPLEALLTERAVSTNTTAAGGNASLMSIG